MNNEGKSDGELPSVSPFDEHSLPSWALVLCGFDYMLLSLQGLRE